MPGHFFVYNSHMPSPRFFPTQDDFREWLQQNHDKKTELIVGFYKKDSGKPSMIWSESVDQALCFGWIDGVRKRLDDEAYTIRFTPRRSNSIWSAINIKKMEVLSKNGLIRPSGAAAFKKRQSRKSAIYSYEKKPAKFSLAMEKRFRENKEAWSFFKQQPDGYRRLCSHFVMSAKQENTRTRRLEKLILASEAEKRI